MIGDYLILLASFFLLLIAIDIGTDDTDSVIKNLKKKKKKKQDK